VGSHIKNAYRKLEVHSAAAAVMRAIELRLIF
jgi:DNA-binding CsgD family transcriptional regulator